MKMNLFFYQLKTTLSALLMVLMLCVNGQAASDSHYGCYWNGDGLANLEIGKYSGRKVSYRIKAERTGTVDSARIFFIYPSGYGRGDGGDILIELKPDDETSNHHPGSTVLSSYVVRNPMAENFPLIHFDTPVQLEKGKRYHLVFSNVASDPINNYVSIDNLYNSARTTGMQPVVEDVDCAVLWKSSGGSSWSVNYGHSPIYNLFYTDGAAQGNGYIDAFSSSGRRTISGSSKVRESITVSGGDKEISDITIRVRKVNASGGLTVRLESTDGQLVELGTIPAASIDSEMSWVTYTFGHRHTLTDGQQFYVVLSSNAGSYTTFGLQQGTGYGFDTDTVFSDGELHYTTGGSWQVDRGGQTDMQFYFSLAGTPAVTKPDPPRNLRIAEAGSN